MNFIKNIKLLLILNILTITIFASEGIIDHDDSKRVKRRLNPIISSLSISHELPASHFFFNREPALAFSGRTYLLYPNLFDLGVPAFWSGVNINKNLQLSNCIISSQFKNQEVYNFGPTATILFGNDTLDWAVNIGSKFFSGPDNFDYHNISVSVSKRFFISNNFKTVIGLSRHFNSVDVNYIAENEEKSFIWSGGINQYFIKIGVFRRFKNIYYGFETNITDDKIGLSFMISGLIP